MNKLVIIFDDLMRAIRKRVYNSGGFNIHTIMMPILKDGALIKFKDLDGNIDEQFTMEYHPGDDELEIAYDRDIYVITKHIKISGKYIDDISDEELKHKLHCAEIPIYSDRYKSEYVKLYLRR